MLFDTKTRKDHCQETLIEDYFFNFPRDPKPPITISYSDWPPRDLSPIRIQLALAGFKPNDVVVYVNQSTLYIEGDNTHREKIPERFRCSFKRVFPAQPGLDLLSAQVDYYYGILTINVPVVEPVESRTYLFGA